MPLTSALSPDAALAKALEGNRVSQTFSSIESATRFWESVKKTRTQKRLPLKVTRHGLVVSIEPKSKKIAPLPQAS